MLMTTSDLEHGFVAACWAVECTRTCMRLAVEVARNLFVPKVDPWAGKVAREAIVRECIAD